jgi:hypothetical protein
MHRIIFFFSVALVFLTVTSCKKSYNYGLDQNVSAVASLFGPQDSLYVKLNPPSGDQVTFEWAPAQAEDGSLVQYLIAFDTTGDDFRHPVYEAASDNNGVNTTATITHSTLNHIANLAGIQSLGTGSIYWTVYSTKGLNKVKAAQTYVMTVTRPAGFGTIPSDVYLTGSATEAGTALASAIHMKQVSSGVFELYTSLKSGTYQFVDGTAGTPNSFYINAGNLQQTGSTTYSDTTAQVHLTLDFNNAVATDTIIRSVDVWYGQFDDVKYHLSYTGNGVWQDQNELIQEVAVSYGWEQLYKFRFAVNAGGTDSYVWFGSINGDNSEPSSSSPASYFYLVPVTDDQWNNSYKFNTAADNNNNCTITVFMQPGGPYYHTVVPQ